LPQTIRIKKGKSADEAKTAALQRKDLGAPSWTWTQKTDSKF